MQTGDYSGQAVESALNDIESRVDDIEGGGSPPASHDYTHETGGVDAVSLGNLDGTLSSTALGATPNDVGSTNAEGTAVKASKTDHVHRGVLTVKKSGGSAIYGTITLAEGTNVTLTQVGNEITIASTASGVTDHGALTGLDDNDHSTVYYAKSEFIATSAGAGDAGCLHRT